MTMGTQDARALIERIHEERVANDRARAELLISAARIANDDNAVGDPDAIVNGFDHSPGVATTTLSAAERMRWFATLMETVKELDRFTLWRRRTATLHHVQSAALDCCVADAANRATIAVAILLYGLPAWDVAA